MTTKITITLSGGMVQDIICNQNDEDVEVIVKDYDIKDYETESFENVKKDEDGEYEETVTVFKKKQSRIEKGGTQMDAFTQGYIACLLWSTEHDEFTANDIEKDSLDSIINDCMQFQGENEEHLSGLDEFQCGHDFYLTRNLHGSGFWDRGLGETGQILTRASQEFNEFYVFENDGKIFIKNN